MSQFPQPGPSFPARQGLAEIDPNRILAQPQQHLGKPAAAGPVVSAVPCPWPKFAPGPLPAPVPASVSKPTSAAAGIVPGAAPSKKRKSDTFENGATDAAASGHESLVDVTEDCNVVRRRIRDLIQSGEMKVGEFQRAIGVSPNAYSTFMKQEGPSAGQRCSTYKQAFAFFKGRELNVPTNRGPASKSAMETPAAKRAKKDDTTKAFDVSDVTLPGEEHGTVPVYDTCNEIRKKIRAFLKKDGMTQAGFCAELTKMVAKQGRRVNASSLTNFLGQKGPSSGSGNIVFYTSYVFFEKLRVKADKPKSQFRLEMERIWGRDGMDIPEDGRGGGQRYYTCFANERPYEDKYGKIHFTGR